MGLSTGAAGGLSSVGAVCLSTGVAGGLSSVGAVCLSTGVAGGLSSVGAVCLSTGAAGGLSSVGAVCLSTGVAGGLSSVGAVCLSTGAVGLPVVDAVDVWSNWLHLTTSSAVLLVCWWCSCYFSYFTSTLPSLHHHPFHGNDFFHLFH